MEFSTTKNITPGSAVQATGTTDKTEEKKDSTTPVVNGPQEGEFDAMMKKLLRVDGNGQVNEEELFAAIIEQRLELENPEAASAYAEAKAKLMVSMARGDGYVPVEDVAKEALKSVVTSGKIDQATGERVLGESFSAAQLDDNLEALYDSRGSAEDPTIAVANMEAALLASRITIEKIASGELTGLSRSFDLSSNSAPGRGLSDSTAPEATTSGGDAPSGAQQLDGKGGFLWKPVSESNGNLVVLLPSSLRGMIERVEIHSALPPSDATKLAEGRFDGDDKNGNRPHFRFSEPGEKFGDDVHVVVWKDNGETITYDIGDGGERHD